MSDDTRQARIEAAAATWWQIAYVDEGDTDTVFADLPKAQQACHYRLMDCVLAAADAAAAPAVGVTVDAAMVERAMKAHNQEARRAVGAGGLIGVRGGLSFGQEARRSAMRAALEAALLTAQPEPGSDTGQPATEGGVTVEEAVSWLAIYQQAVIDVYLRGGGAAKDDLTEYTNHLIALLTAQPEPGSDTGQPATEGGVTVDVMDLRYALDAWRDASKSGNWWGDLDRYVHGRLSALLTAQPGTQEGAE